MKRRILLVDDELAILLTLKAILEIHGFDVETAASAKEAVSKLKANSYRINQFFDVRCRVVAHTIISIQISYKLSPLCCKLII